MTSDPELGGMSARDRATIPPSSTVVAVIAAGVGVTEALRPLVRALARHVEVRAAGRVERPDAYLVAGMAARDQVPDGAPVAIAEDGKLAIRRGDAAQIVDLPGPRTVDTAAWPPIPPHVRRRWRARLGLADDLVVATAALDPDDVSTALAVAAAAVVDVGHLPLALALGCPSVVSPEAADAVGAEPDLDLVVGGRPEADALAADDRRAALVSRRGRALAVAALDPAPVVATLLQAWGLAPTGLPARLGGRLAELGTAPAAPVRRRLDELLAPVLTGSTGGP